MKGLSASFKNVSKRMGSTQALDGLRLELSPGRLHGLIGPDGAGKTTALRHLVGLLSPDQGRVAWADAGKARPLSRVRDDLAYMPQAQSLYPDLSVSEHLDFFRDLFGLEEKDYRERRKRLLSLTRLDRFTDRPAGKLSGGMYKKLGLMCSLLARPRALLLDEPTNGVDPVSRREFWELLMDLLKEDILIVVSTAYMDEAERCDEVHLVEGGKLLAAGEPRRLLEDAGVSRFDELFMAREKP